MKSIPHPHFSGHRDSLSASPSKRIAYYSIVQSSYGCLAGSFEMPMAIRLAGGPAMVAAVYAFYYLNLFLGFALGTFIGRKGRLSRVFRLELSLLACLNLGSAFFFPLLSSAAAVGFYFCARGLAEGLYWSARHPALLWSIGDKGRDEFALKLQSVSVCLSVVFPLISGALVSFMAGHFFRPSEGLPAGYAWVFALSGGLMALALLFAPRLHIDARPFSLGRSLAMRKRPEAASLRSYIWLIAMAGVIVSVGSGILTFGVLKTEFRIGALSAGVALLSSVFFALVRKWRGRHPGARLTGVLTGACADTVSRLIYALFPSGLGLGFKSVLDSAAVPLKSLFGENIQKAHVERIARFSGTSIPEIFLFQEWRLFLGRLSSCVIFGLLVHFLGGTAELRETIVRLLLALLAPAAILEFFCLRKFVREDGLPGTRLPNGAL